MKGMMNARDAGRFPLPRPGEALVFFQEAGKIERVLNIGFKKPIMILHLIQPLPCTD
jgi:hypothetical protein